MDNTDQDQLEHSTWDLFLDGAHSPWLNMAIDQALLETASKRDRPLLRFYDWDRPSVSIGYMQSRATVTIPGVDIVRRPTGGGVVDHRNDLTYSVILPPSHHALTLDALRSYAYVNTAIKCGLEKTGFHAELSQDIIPKAVDRRSMVCFHHPTRYDIIADGIKIAGSAQRKTANGLLHQGSIVIPKTAKDLSQPRLIEAVQEGFEENCDIAFTQFVPQAEFMHHYNTLSESRFSTPDWNNRR